MIVVTAAGETVNVPDPVISTVQVIKLAPFTQPNNSGLRPAGSLVGQGVGRTVYEIPAMTSQQTSPTTGTNQFYLIRTGGMSSTAVASGLEVGAFTLIGTPQGNLYNGLEVGYSTAAHVHDLAITGVPGSGSSPPGETFSLNLWHADDALVEDVTIDGRDNTGSPIAASLFATNSVVGGTYNRITANHAKYGFGAALWDSTNLTFTDCDFSNNRKGVNIEKPRGGYHTFIRPIFRGITGAAYVMQVNSDGTGPSTVVTIEDPVVDSWPLTVWVNASAQQLQKPSDIHLVLNGVDVSGDPSKLKVTGTG